MSDTPSRKRSFANARSETGTAAQVRSQVSAAFSAGGSNGDRSSTAALLASSSVNTILGPSLGNAALTVPSYGGGVSESGRTLSHSVSVTSTVPMELNEPIDYEDFVKKNQSMLEGEPLRDLVLFPEDDVTVTTLPRKLRTVDIPVPGSAKRCDDPLVKDCVHSFTQDWTVVNRKYGSFHGQDEQFLSRRFSTCRRTPSYASLLPKHQYEVDMPKNGKISDTEKKLYRASMTSTIDYNLEAAESNNLLVDLLESHDDVEVDRENSSKRSSGRHHSLFGLYPLLDRGEAKETRSPVLPPAEHKGLRLLVKVSELKFELNVEPMFAVMALYDAKEKKKISESFHLDCNTSEIQQKWRGHGEERSMASLARSAIFNITYPSSDVYLIIKIEKILQQGDISDACEPYIKAKDMDKKNMEKCRNNADFFCQQLGKYRMPFAWTAIGVLDILAGNQGSGQGGGASSAIGAGGGSEGGKGEKTGTLERRGGTLDPNKKRDAHSGSLTNLSNRGLEDSYSAADKEATLSRKQDSVAMLTQDFCPVTLTVNGFFRQESDKLSDEDLYRSLSEMKKSLAAFNRKTKSIPGNLKVDISSPDENLSCCLTSNLWEIDPFPDKRSRRPTREIEEFPTKEVYSPYTTYKNMLYVYPLSVDFRNGKGRNIGVKVQFMSGEEKEDVCPAIYGKSCSPSFLREAWCPVIYHNRQPEFYEEVKIELPAKLTSKHHLLFSFYQISCQKPRPGEHLVQEPTFLGCSWIPLLEDGKIQLGEFNLPVASERPPPSYSQLSSNVFLPNLKWVDSHKPVFKISLSMVSSIHPKDPHLLSFMLSYYQLNSQLAEEKELSQSINALSCANSESLVQFLHITLSNLCNLLVRPATNEESIDTPSKAFEALSMIVQKVSNLGLPTDKHGRNLTLASYVKYVFNAPQGLASAESMSYVNRTSTLVKGRAGSSGKGDADDIISAQSAAAAAFKKGGSVRGTKGVTFNVDVEEIPEIGAKATKSPSHSSAKKFFHEEMVLQWIVIHPSSRPLLLKNAWFFFELLIKAMGQHVSNSDKLNSPRRERFSSKFLEDLETLVGSIAMEICNKHVQDCEYAKRLNTSLAFFIHDAFSLMDRGFVFILIKTYLKRFALSVKDLNLPEFKLDLLRIVCSHEHYVVLNLPLGTLLYTGVTSGSQHSSPSGSISSTIESLDMPNLEAMGELSHEFRHYHYLSGLVLSELARVLVDGKSPKLREQAIQVLRDLLAGHDSDLRYNSSEARSKIASVYLPLLSVVMDNYQLLYKGADGWEDWTTTFERNTSGRRRSVVIRGDATDGSLEVEQEPVVENVEILGPVSTRNLLVCFLWVIKSINKDLLSNWWFTLSISRLDSLLNVLDLCVSCFEYRGKQHLSSQTSNIATTSKGSDVKSQLANAILHGVGSAREMLKMRKAQAQAQAQADVLRWGKTYWQAASEHADRPKVDVEVDAKIEGSLAAEASLIVLDTLELLVQTLSLEGQAMLGRTLEVLLHLMGSNQSTEVMRNVFATQRAIVSKFPELVFEDETELCAELCTRLLRHCSSNVAEVRALACCSIYLLMRQNYNELGSTFARVKVQVTIALSSIVAGTSNFNEHHLRRSLKTLITYAQSDQEMDDENFPEQVRELSLNLHRILLDTVKMQEFQDDPEMLMDLMYRISKGYQDSPDLRLTWLQHMAEKHNSRRNFTEAAMCWVHAAALVAEYLYLLEGRPYLPIGCVAFQTLSPNVLEESAISDDIVAPEEEGLCTSKSFSEQGLIDLLENAASFFFEDQVYEAVNEVYKLIVPIYESHRNHVQLGKVYIKLSDCYKEMVAKGQHRFLCSYFRVGFYGLIFGDLDGQEFIYKEPALTRLGEFSLKLQKLYEDKLGNGLIELLKDSGIIDLTTLNPAKGYLQVTYVEPYFDEWENKERTTVFDKSFNVRRFSFNTPFTPSGKAHGDVKEQYMRKTILTSMESFPYVKKRSKVVKLDTVDLPPLEVAIMGMQDKIESLKHTLSQHPPDAKLLQMQLQGGIATSVNQGPFHIAQSFLDLPPDQYTYHHRRLKICFKEFTRRCWEALEVNKKLITEEQKDYQKELVSNFRVFCDKLEPMVNVKKKHKRSRDRALINIAGHGAGASRSSRHYSSSSTSTETS